MWFLWYNLILMIHLCVRPTFSPCLLLRARSALWARGRFVFYIHIFSAVFSVLGNLITFFTPCFLWSVITLSPVVSNGSVPPAQQRCVQMSNERVIPVVFLCVYVSWIVALDDVITLSLPHLFTLYVSLSLIVQCFISSVFTSRYNTISFPYSSSLCAYRSVWMYKSEHYCSKWKVREAQRVKEMQGERRHIFNSPFTFASRSLLFLFFCLSFFSFSLIDLAVERRAKRGSGANRGKVNKASRGRERDIERKQAGERKPESEREREG